MMMQHKVWNFDQFSELSQQFHQEKQQYKNHVDLINGGKFELFDNSSPPPPYSKEDLLNFQTTTAHHNTATHLRYSSSSSTDNEEKDNIHQSEGGVGSKKENRQQYDDVGEEITVTVRKFDTFSIHLVITSIHNYLYMILTIILPAKNSEKFKLQLKL